MNNSSDINEQLIELQIRLSYQEDLITQLNLVVTKQDADITQLQQQVRILAKKLEEFSYSDASDAPLDDHERPPHY